MWPVFLGVQLICRDKVGAHTLPCRAVGRLDKDIIMKRMQQILTLLLGACFLITAHALAAHTLAVQAQSIRKDLPPHLRPQNNVTSFNRRVVENTDHPWQAIGRVNIGGTTHCSGTLVAANVVLTAAHCLFSRRMKKMVVPSSVHFLAGYSKGEFRGHSKVKTYLVGPGFDGKKWNDKTNAMHDWALLTLTKPLGEDLGFLSMPVEWFGPSATPSQNKRNNRRAIPGVGIDELVTTAGYPGDRKHVLSLEENCKIVATANSGRILFTNCIALSGDSGGPILRQKNNQWNIVGIQTAAIRVNDKVSGVGLSAMAYHPYLESMTP